MEKQKIFWVVLSVSVFVVIVLIVGVYLLRQKPQAVTSSPGTVNPIEGPGPQVFEYSQQKPQPQATPGTEQKPEGPQTMHFYIGEGAERPPAVPQTPAPAAQPALPSAQPAPPALAQPQVQPQVSPPAPTAHVPVTATHPRTVAAVPRRAPLTVKPSKPAHKEVDYWIQTGAYKSQSKAEELISTLADKGLPGKVFSYDSDSGTYYRVRIGPYTNQGEADKFLSIVKQIQGLEASYVSQVVPRT